MTMDSHVERLHRTLIQMLVDSGQKEAAAIMIDTELVFAYDDSVRIFIPFELHKVVLSSPKIKNQITSTLNELLNLNSTDNYEHDIDFRTELMEVEPDWKEAIKVLILESGERNQGVITEKVFSRKSKRPLVYNEMKFGSRSEIEIAKELEKRRVLFFPLPLAVRSDTGANHLDHREVDFLICHDGVWGILEVAYHPDRYEQDKEKDAWFKESGILCIERYTAERCFNHPSDVVGEFLGILAKHKR